MDIHAEVQQNGQNGIHQGLDCIAITYGDDRKETAERIAALLNASTGKDVAEVVRLIQHGPAILQLLERWYVDSHAGERLTHLPASKVRAILQAMGVM